jgi:hypothetical protein
MAKEGILIGIIDPGVDMRAGECPSSYHLNID